MGDTPEWKAAMIRKRDELLRQAAEVDRDMKEIEQLQRYGLLYGFRVEPAPEEKR